ncbi:Bgt-2080 [Blumeria graminis f. sp. tritici]|uniref:Bgt-2080 n=2 Tax=Blumeria graminis f. sp. tritici TaxID=62690 RepID=A0A381L523_BLUGR|nr:NipSnap2 protein [Blumeria graminis f. sp. tritici 96224]VCU39061.1 Bgt-2080 [Blumeria graminis f. sp. tritici]
MQRQPPLMTFLRCCSRSIALNTYPGKGLLRKFSGTAASSRGAPILSEGTAAGVQSFEEKRRAFRARLSELRSDEFSESVAEASPKEVEGTEGKLSSLIYGTKEGRDLDRQIEASFSQIIARGKYVHSIVFHEVKPDKVDEYTELVGGWYPKMAEMADNKVNLVVHIWEYQRYSGYHASLHSIASQPGSSAFDKKLKSLITTKKSSLMQEFSFWPTTPPRQLGGVFELRSYTLKPGCLLEWESHWRRGLEARKELMEGVGAWFVQIGALNTVHHLWQYADLEERKIRREKSWSVEGWGETVYKTVPLIQNMQSQILMPCEWSPVA